MKSCIKITFLISIFVALIAIILAFTLYQVKSTGVLHLKNMRGKEAKIIREKDTMITHLRGETFESVTYAQGFSHAQTRLWNLEKMRRLSNGEISELFGEDLLPLDKFMRAIGIKGAVNQAWDKMLEEDRKMW